MADDIKIMTSGAFTAAHLALIPLVERRFSGRKVATLSTSVGTGENSIPNRLKRGEVVDVVIVADKLLLEFIRDGLVLADTYTPLVRSTIGMAIRAGAPAPDISSVEALKHALLKAKSIAYSASVSGQYLTGELYQRLGIADQVLGKSRLIGDGVRVGAVIAAGEAEIGFQQMSELIPIPGIGHITPLPREVQKVSLFSAGVAATSTDRTLSSSVIKFFASPEAASIIASSGLEPLGAPQ